MLADELVDYTQTEATDQPAYILQRDTCWLDPPRTVGLPERISSPTVPVCRRSVAVRELYPIGGGNALACRAAAAPELLEQL
jgi:hypothetical protein